MVKVMRNICSNTLIRGWTKINEEKKAVYWPAFVNGDKHILKTENSTEYIDAKSSLLCTSFGHNNKDILLPVIEQLRTLAFSQSGDYHNNLIASKLSKELIALTQNYFSKVYLSTTGTSGVELAFIFTFLYHYSKTDFNRKIICSYKDSYHGCSLGVNKYTGSKEWLQMISSSSDDRIKLSLPNCSRCDNYEENGMCSFKCLQELEESLENIGVDKIAAIIIEPVTTKVVLPPKEYYRKIREITKKNGVILIFDEVVTGFGRIGKDFAFLYYDIKPDILILSKALSNGILPIAATLITNEVYDEIAKNDFYLEYGSTQDGNPTCCMASLATIDFFKKIIVVTMLKIWGID
jgi:adenosylmethionine-8-amino-7-oxononanoate aminotransferase